MTTNGDCDGSTQPKQQKMSVELEEFDAIFPELLDCVTSHGKGNTEIREAVEWFREVSAYNVPFGKKNRGISVVATYKHLNPVASPDDLKLARILGWCIEWLQAFFLVADDIMDKSITRRGKPCWYKKEGVGSVAINDAFYLEACVYDILRKYFKGKPYYSDLLDLFHETTLQTVTGQCLDLITSPEDRVNFELFTEDRYLAIVKWKTAFYSFYLPVALAMTMAGVNDEQTHESAKNILLKMGTFFQIQDDYLDCYGDPVTIGKIGTDIEDNKCSWLVVQALKQVTPEQKAILQENYGQTDPANIAKVKQLYRELELQNLYKEYEESSYQELLSDISDFTGNIPKDIFKDFAKKIYKRNK